MHAELEELDRQLIETTVGRVIFNMHLPKEIPFINGLLKKRGLQDLVGYCFIKLGNDKTVEMLDEIKEVTFLYATRAGISFGVDDMVVPSAQAGDPPAGAQRGGRDREAALGRRHHRR